VVVEEEEEEEEEGRGQARKGQLVRAFAFSLRLLSSFPFLFFLSFPFFPLGITMSIYYYREKEGRKERRRRLAGARR